MAQEIQQSIRVEPSHQSYCIDSPTIPKKTSESCLRHQRELSLQSNDIKAKNKYSLLMNGGIKSEMHSRKSYQSFKLKQENKNKAQSVNKIYEQISGMKDKEQRVSAKNTIVCVDHQNHQQSSFPQKCNTPTLILKNSPTKNPTKISIELKTPTRDKKTGYNRINRSKNKFLQIQLDRQDSMLYKSLPQPFINKKHIHNFDNGMNETGIQFDRTLGFMQSGNQYLKNRVALIQHRKYGDSISKELKSLEVNYARDTQSRQRVVKQSFSIGMQQYDNFDKTQRVQSSYPSTSAVRKNINRYKKKKLEPLKNPVVESVNIRQKMSNNIKDYLSVEKIQIKEIQDQLMITEKLVKQEDKKYDLKMAMHVKSNIQKKKPSSQRQRQKERVESSFNTMSNKSNKELIALTTDGNQAWAKKSTFLLNEKGNLTGGFSETASFQPKRKFKCPFKTYFYKDFIWKVAFSNQLIVECPIQYASKIKVFLGKGNNSNLIKSIIKRRSWLLITDKIQEASFAWTQIKVHQFFQLQKPCKKFSKQLKNVNYEFKIDSSEDQSPLLKTGKSLNQNKLFNAFEKRQFHDYWKKNMQKQCRFKAETMSKNRSKLLDVVQIKAQNAVQMIRIHNHFRNNFMIGNKKALFHIMSQFYGISKAPKLTHIVSIQDEQLEVSPLDQQLDEDSTKQKTQEEEAPSIPDEEDVFDNLPLTFHVKKGLADDEYLKFLQHYYAISKDIKRLTNKTGNAQQLQKYPYRYNAWIIKPGQNTNRGNGIIVCLNLNDIKAILKRQEKHNDGTYKTYIIQKYIEKPLLYKKRKFDLRHYILMSCSNGIMKGYWYSDGYVRTTSAEYTLKFSSGSVHLTNDAVQKQLPDYGKYEKGNKITYDELNSYIKDKIDKDFDFFKIVMPKMKKISTDIMKASAKLMDPAKGLNNFQLFGLDFMIQQNYDVKLIEVNSNPCLQVSSPLLSKIIPPMVESIFKYQLRQQHRICIDPVFPPPSSFNPSGPHSKHFTENSNLQNQFELIYDERVDQPKKRQPHQSSENVAGSQHNNQSSTGTTLAKTQSQKDEQQYQELSSMADLIANKDFEQDDDVFDDQGEALDD